MRHWAHIRQKRNRHDIKVYCEDELLLAKMDAKLIVQVIINLVDNAIKYTPYGTSIRIVAKKESKAVAVSVIDNGPGIPKEIKPRVLICFIRENNVADSRRSLGLGLALCKSIINAARRRDNIDRQSAAGL